LQRAVIEHIYPRVRGRGLFGREICIGGRYSPYLVPFLDHRVVAEAMTVPLPLKHAGRFEAQLLNMVDPSLARRQSAYGHDFARPPSLRHRFEEWSTRIRPTWLRRRSYSIQRRLRPLSDEHGGLFSADYMGRVIDLEFPIMRRHFRLERIRDSGLWRRIACLEYLAAFLGTRLSTL
jgi:asparagine synthase (glutamine-hydrolysing)